VSILARNTGILWPQDLLILDRIKIMEIPQAGRIYRIWALFSSTALVRSDVEWVMEKERISPTHSPLRDLAQARTASLPVLINTSSITRRNSIWSTARCSEEGSKGKNGSNTEGKSSRRRLDLVLLLIKKKRRRMVKLEKRIAIRRMKMKMDS